MPDLYVVAYLAGREHREPPRPSAIASALHRAARSQAFPYDAGDDPAFFAANYNKGAVTWGVCRPDVRRAITLRDWVAFFSAERDRRDAALTRYKFVAALSVERRVSQVAIFGSPANRLFRNYLNLLIRPKESGWEHYEPGLNPSNWHDDWLWRISDPRGLRKMEFVMAGESHRSGTALTIRGQRTGLADNYVIFSRSDAVILDRPILVAIHRRGESKETWQRRWTRLRDLLFGQSSRGLRTSNHQRPHRHFRRALGDPSWPKNLRGLLDQSVH